MPPQSPRCMKQESIHQKFTAALDALVEQVKEDRSDPRGHPLRQPVARHGLGEVRHRPGARDDRRQEGRDGPTLALYADGVNVHAFLMPRAEFRKIGRRARSATRSCTRSWRRGGCSTRTTRRSPTSARGCARSASATRRCSSSARRRAPCRRSTRPTSGSSRAATSTTPRCGFSTPRRRWRRSR